MKKQYAHENDSVAQLNLTDMLKSLSLQYFANDHQKLAELFEKERKGKAILII